MINKEISRAINVFLLNGDDAYLSSCGEGTIFSKQKGCLVKTKMTSKNNIK